jgi:hypothetical protein
MAAFVPAPMSTLVDSARRPVRRVVGRSRRIPSLRFQLPRSKPREEGIHG